MSSVESVTATKSIDFGFVPVQTEVERIVCFENNEEEPLTYRVSLMYLLNNIDRVFKVSVNSTAVNPGKVAQVRVLFRPNIPEQTFTEYYIVEDSSGNVYRLTITGKCYGPRVYLNRKKLKFTIFKYHNDSSNFEEEVCLVNKSTIDTTYQWIIPGNENGFFQISTGHCGLIKAMETINVTITFTGSSLGVYTAEIVCLVLNQPPLFLNVVAKVLLMDNEHPKNSEHKFYRCWKDHCKFTHLMENSLQRLNEIPPASVYDTYLDFGTGCTKDITKNVSQTLCVTNHTDLEGFIQWTTDPDNIFLIDPIYLSIPPKESRMFTVRFRPNRDSAIYGFVFHGDYQYSITKSRTKLHHVWFRIPCIAETMCPCSQMRTDIRCLTEITMPPTVPWRATFTNFMLSNILDVPMSFKFHPPDVTNFCIMPMCGVVHRRGWEIISVALEPKTKGDYYENWRLVVNKAVTVRICLMGNAEESVVEVMSHGYDPDAHATLECEPTITGCTNYITSYIHNQTRMNIHMRVLSSVSWLGADNYGSIVLPPREMVRYFWWFYPRTADKVYKTKVTCSCICLIGDRPVGEPSEIFISISGFSELPDLRVLPKQMNLHDLVVSENMPFNFTLYNIGSCCFTSKLFYTLDGMDDDHSEDSIFIANEMNTLKGCDHCEIEGFVIPNSAGPRQINIKYTVLYRDEAEQIIEIAPITKTICTIWYDGIYPIMQVQRTISVQCPVILTNHCVWNILNIEALNKALVDVRPHKPIYVDLYTPDLCVGATDVELILVFGCVFKANVSWSLTRIKICDCEMEELPLGISMFTKKHTCWHRDLVELSPIFGVVCMNDSCLITLHCNYTNLGDNTLRYELNMSNDRNVFLDIHIKALLATKHILLPLRRVIDNPEYLTVLDCGKVPINNLDPVVRLAWLYNPTEMFTTWRLLRGTSNQSLAIRCLLYFAEIAPLGRLAIPFAFLPTEMIGYESVFLCSFGYDTMRILVKGEGGLPNCIETRLDIPKYVNKNSRHAYHDDVVYLSKEHLTVQVLPTYSLTREILAINNDTKHVQRFIWLPERIPNILNIVITPWWGVLQPKGTEWITMTIYTLQTPATFTTTVACEILDMTARHLYQRNEYIKKNKIEKCNQEFIITEDGLSFPDINDSPPYVLDLKRPEPSYLAMTVSVSTKGQRDGITRMHIKQILDQGPAFDLDSSDTPPIATIISVNNLSTSDIIRVIDGLLWDALHSKQFKYQIEYYNKEHIPKYKQLIKAVNSKPSPELSKSVTSGVCDAIVNQAVFHVYGLDPKNKNLTILEI